MPASLLLYLLDLLLPIRFGIAMHVLAPQPSVPSAEMDVEGIRLIKKGSLRVLYHIDSVFRPYLAAINSLHPTTSQIEREIDHVDLLLCNTDIIQRLSHGGMVKYFLELLNADPFLIRVILDLVFVAGVVSVDSSHLITWILESRFFENRSEKPLLTFSNECTIRILIGHSFTRSNIWP